MDKAVESTPAVHDDVDRALLAQVVQVSTDAIYTEDLDGCITSWNAAAEVLYRRSASQALGAPAATLTPDEYRTELDAARDRALSGSAVQRFDTVQQRADGSYVPVSLTVSPLRGPDGEVTGVATSAVDITERAHLQAEVENATRQLEAQQQVLLRSNRDLEQFAYVASHDLSEPLRVITGYVQLLERRYGDVLDERGERYVRHVVEGCTRMRALIDDLLHYSRFLRIEREAQDVDLAAVAAQVVEGLRSQIDETGATVVIGELVPVHGDQASIAAMLQNLVNNAVKFHAPGSQPRVEVSTVVDGGWVDLCVDDNGIGIAPEFREKVFRMFQRLHVREDYGGTGIGLAVVQKVAEQSGGHAWVEGSALGGSRFCVRLPGTGRAVPTGEEPS
ncbi:MAG: sensor histidine kinase [Actinomycetes bacterium]